MKKNVLFYSPFMGHTGSEMMIKYIVSNVNKIRPVILSGENGDLLNEIPKNIPVYIYYNNYNMNIWEKILDRLLNKFSMQNLALLQFKKIIKKHNIELIVINTIVADKIIPLVKKCNIPFVVYAHELPSLYNLLSIENFKYIINNAKGVIGCSQLVCENLKIMGFKNVKLFYEGVNYAKIETLEKIENEIKWMGYSYVFAMSGTLVDLKGFHIVIDIAKYIKQYNAAFIWIGAHSNNSYEFYLKNLIKNYSLENIIFTGLLKGDEYYSWLNACDAFLLTSMSDSYPIVMLEAAYLQKPIIAFDSGGVTEFVKEGMGKVVPYYCVNAYLDAIKDFIEGKIPVDKELLRKEAEKHDITKRIGEFEDIILSFIE